MSLNSVIIHDTINEAEEGLVMVLVVTSINPADRADLMVPSSRGVAQFFIEDDDSEIYHEG